MDPVGAFRWRTLPHRSLAIGRQFGYICSGAQSKCGGRAIKGGFRRTISENIGDAERTLFETERTVGETDAR